MYRITLIFKPDFNESGFIPSRAKYQTDSALSAMLIIRALGPCCQDYKVSFGDPTKNEKRIEYTPQQWAAEIKRLRVDDPQAIVKQVELF